MPPTQVLPLDPAEISKMKAAFEDAKTKDPGKAEALAAAVDSQENKEIAAEMGYGLPFDPRSLITSGFVEKLGEKIREGFYVDIHGPVPKFEDIMAERLVQDYATILGGLTLTKSYYEQKSCAMLAMAITRINSVRFPNPSRLMEFQDPETFKVRWEAKRELLGIIMEVSTDLVNDMMEIYVGLGKVEGGTEKKS